MNMICTRSISALAVGALMLSAVPALAAEHGGGHGGGFGGHGFSRPSAGHDFGGHFRPDFHGRDFGRFSSREHALWTGGGWRHDWHGGRYGWWWVLGDDWYFYPEPIYPYPTYVPPAVVGMQPPPVPSGMPPVQSWYFCDNPQGYYPYVASCNGAWHEVPAGGPPAASPPSAAG
jgi:hypothetical protein